MYANHFSYSSRLCVKSVPHTVHLQIVYMPFNSRNDATCETQFIYLFIRLTSMQNKQSEVWTRRVRLHPFTRQFNFCFFFVPFRLDRWTAHLQFCFVQSIRLGVAHAQVENGAVNDTRQILGYINRND